MRFLRAAETRRADMDLTPMIDVTLQLIIFFMFTTQFAQSITSPIDLPEVPGETRQAPAGAEVVIDVTGGGVYIVDGKEVDLEWCLQAIAREFRREDQKPPTVLVRADRGAPAVHINRLAQGLTEIGVKAWRLGAAGDGGAR
ncbi:MAG: biopolymer transporter ExbD [Phycisphaeraceae bacterium]|nr:biopolymer transporter ExbD [Phycisphaeraceae bacterium]